MTNDDPRVEAAAVLATVELMLQDKENVVAAARQVLGCDSVDSLSPHVEGLLAQAMIRTVMSNRDKAATMDWMRSAIRIYRDGHDRLDDVIAAVTAEQAAA